MRKTILALSAAALALGGTGVAMADHHGGKHGSKHGPMGADADGNGEISLAEMRAHSAERFARMDANGDGQIDAADRAARHAERFAKADTNGDGELSQAEMKAAHEARMEMRAERRAQRQAKKFERLDKDNNGGVSEAEMKAAHEARAENRRERRAMRGAERHQGHEGMRKMRGMHAMHMLRMADANGDKIVTRAEFDAAVTAHFAKIDSDGSGSISAEERKAAREAMMERMKQRHGQHKMGDKPGA